MADIWGEGDVEPRIQWDEVEECQQLVENRSKRRGRNPIKDQPISRKGKESKENLSTGQQQPTTDVNEGEALNQSRKVEDMPREEATAAEQPSERTVALQRGPCYGVDAKVRLKTKVGFLSEFGRDLGSTSLLLLRSGMAMRMVDDVGRFVGHVSVFHSLLCIFCYPTNISIFV